MTKKGVKKPGKKIAKQKSRKKRSLKTINYPSVALVFFILLFSLFIAANLGNSRIRMIDLFQQVVAARRTDDGYNSMAGCASKTSRPCFDKLTGNDVNLLGKNGQNVFTSCISNAAPNKVGEFIHKSAVCGQEKVMYCHDGRSSNYIRKFTGECSTNEPPSPQPTLEPSPSTPPVSDVPFRIVYPNGGEQLPFGNEVTVRWEGGDTTNEWPIYLSIIDWDRYVAIREMVIATPNDGQEQWIVDLPPGNYFVFYGQGCRFSTCVNLSQWDYSDAKFSVVSGQPIEKVQSSYPLNQSLVVLSPSGGETWLTGATQYIKWSGLKTDSKVKLYLIDDAEWSTYTVITPDTNNDGFETWTIPEYIPPKKYKMYIGCNNCGTAPSGFTGGFYNYSFYPFTIQ